MTPQEALNLLDQAAAAVTGNRETHVQLQMAITVIRAELGKNEPKPEPKE